MLNKAFIRVSEQTKGKVGIIQGDIREVSLSKGSFDIILAGAVLYHLRENRDWEQAFKNYMNY
ncbi:hypothetical protein GGR21_003558 [Dysgonomonas hofstadii]|uniref:Methyltransferase type 11 domain-containing protein n=1 Tax=Dysgonomonas hofstadii TaxID=637886 RepID=A0A840CTX1_9BACT|nr:class I SAM-dependent methyltransferase [Dysgonomonas hofstadii]MBB4037638.1 hypothetical protein [Dysgonomonas hofstadii]